MSKKIFSILLVMCMITYYIPSNAVYAAQKQGTFNLSISETNTSVPGRADILLDWDEYNYKNTSTKYLVARKNLVTGTWEYRGDYGRDVIKVLNVYPDIAGSEQLDDWMHSLSKKYDNVNIEVSEVGIKEFNNHYKKYLYKDSEGSYNYDVIVFGFWDSYNEKFVNKNAVNYIQTYVDSGGGLLLGHDTILYGFNSGGFSDAGFNQFATKNLDIVPAQNWGYYAVYSDMINVRQQGSVTSYPFDINGMNLSIPLSHTIGQVPLDDDSVYLTFAKNYYPSEGDGPYYNYNLGGKKEGDGLVHKGNTYIDNAYLVIKNNVGFIQTGHTSGKSNLPEQMVIANVIYSLTNIHHSTTAVDQILDTKRPDIPNYEVSIDEISFSSNDKGNGYKYRIMAMPLGMNTPTLDSGLIAALDNDNLKEYSKGDIKFSNSVDASVGGVLKEYEYILNKSATLSAVNNGKVLALDKNYKIKLPSNGLTNDEYLHIVAIDRANNRSLVRSINLWNVLENVKVIVNYEDVVGNKIAEVKEVNKKYGSIFSPEVKVILGYNYSNSLPKEEIIVGIDGDEVTEIYDKYIEKDIFIATHYELDGTTSVSLYNSVNNNYNDEVTFKAVEISNKEFLKYYTLGSVDGEPISTNGNMVTMIWEDDEQDIYAHYSQKVTSATVEFVRADTKEVLDTFVKEGYVEDTINIDGDEIFDNVEIENLRAYSNSSDVSESRKIYLEEDPSKNIVTVELKPNKRTILHYGVDYTTTGSAIRMSKNFEVLSIDKMVYEDEIVKPIELIYDGVDGWKALESSEGKVVDFTSHIISNYLIGYYKGILPSEEYNYTVDYINSVDESELKTQYNSGSMHIYDPANIPIEEFENITIDGVDRKVTFDPISVVVTNPIGEVRTFSMEEDFTSFVPEIDADNKFINGNYNIVINYRPYTKISYTDAVYKSDGVTLDKTSAHSKKVPYNNETYYFAETMPLSKYNIVDVKIDGVSIDNPEEFDFSVTADSYGKTVHIVYKEKAYKLRVTLIDSYVDGAVYTFDVFTNIPPGKTVEFDIPTYPAFIYESSYVGDNTPQSYMVEEDGKILFTADKEGDYEIFLNYRELSNVKTKYFNMKGEPLADSELETVLKGDTYDVSIPSGFGYKLMHGYLNGEKYTEISENETYTIDVSERLYEIDLYYKKLTYILTVEYSEGGIAFGGGEYQGDDIVSLTAKPYDGYQFAGWKFILQNDATMGEFTEYTPTNGIDIKMPYDDVIVRADFIKKEDVPEDKNTGSESDDKTENDDSDEIENIIDEIDIEIPPELEKLLPFLPDLENITEADILRVKRENMPYLHGYPEGMIYPDASISRSEVVQVIYNLYGQYTSIDFNGLDKFSDVDYDQWYSEAIAFAYQSGVIQGYEDGTFRPNNPITRVELVSIISKFDIKPQTFVESKLTDIDDSWGKESILKLVEHKIITGYADGTFKPNKSATRAEFVKMVNNLIDRPNEYKVENTFPDLTLNHWAYGHMMNAANGTTYDFDVDEVLYYLEVVKSKLNK